MMIKTIAPKILLELTNSYKINILDKKPVKGGIPATEKKIIMKERDQRLLFLKKLDKLDMNNTVDSLE